MTHGYKNVFGEERVTVSVFETGDTVLDTLFTDWFFGLGGISGAGNIATAFAAGLAALTLVLSPVSISGAETFGQPSVSVEVNLTNAGNIASAEAFGQPGLSYSVVGAGNIATTAAYGTPSASQVITASGIATAGGYGQPALSLTVTPTGIDTGAAFGAGSIAQTITATSVGGAEAFGSPTLEEITETWLYPVSIASGDAHGQPSIAAQLSPGSLETAEELGEPSISWAYNFSISGIDGAEAFGTAEVTRDYILAKVVKNAAKQPVANADVLLFDSYTKALIGQTTTDSTGKWIFHISDQYSHYFVVVFKDNFAGITRNTLVGA